jgi:hypothetical protein
MIEDLHWESLEARRQRSSVILFYRVINLIVAVPLIYHPTPVNPAIATRFSLPHCYTLYQPRINAYKHSFFVKTVTLWNQLPAATAEAPTLVEFKRLLGEHTF